MRVDLAVKDKWMALKDREVLARHKEMADSPRDSLNTNKREDPI